MVKIICDLCGKENTQGYGAEVFKSRDGINYEKTNLNIDICAGCLERIKTRKYFTVPEENDKKPGKKEKPAKEPEKEKPEEESGKELKAAAGSGKQEGSESPAAGSEEAPQGNNLNKTKLDLGKIWALAHGKVPWTLKEIAEEMGCSTTTIYYHLSKMRKERGED